MAQDRRRNVPNGTGQKEKCTEWHRTDENSVLKYRREREKMYENVDFSGKNTLNSGGH
jgi:hypothetical protein